MQAVKDTLASERQVIASDAQKVEEDLAAAKPALDEAEAALNAITQKDIVMLKSLKKPPEVIKRLFDGPCIICRGRMQVFDRAAVPAYLLNRQKILQGPCIRCRDPAKSPLLQGPCLSLHPNPASVCIFS